MKSLLIKFSFLTVAIISLAAECQCNHEKCPGEYREVFLNCNDAVIYEYDQLYSQYTAHEKSAMNRPDRVIADGLDGKDSVEVPPQYDTPPQSVYEVRLANGWSSTIDDDPFIYLTDTTYRIECPESDADEDEERYYYEVDVTRRKIDYSLIKRPPLYLHLTCDDLFDATSGNFYRHSANHTSKGKEWEYVSITDDQGADLTTHPDWACIADNKYWFLKEMKIAYYPGTLYCDGEDIPEYRLDSYIYFGYSISVENPGNFDNPGQIQIRTNVSQYVEGLSDVVFTITSSDFDEIVGTIEVDGRTANFVAQPL